MGIPSDTADWSLLCLGLHLSGMALCRLLHIHSHSPCVGHLVHTAKLLYVFVFLLSMWIDEINDDDDDDNDISDGAAVA